MSRLVKFFWGNLRGEELKKFSILSFGAFFLIGSYWPLKPLKESIFINMIGASYLPDAKLMTVLFCVPLVLFYTKLVDYISRQKLIYLFVSIYAVLGLVFIGLLQHPTIGLANTVQSPTRLLGWGFYLFAESYLTVMVAMFWSFVGDITNPESAKKGYGFIVFGSQLGGFLFSFIGKLLIADTSQYVKRVPMIVGLSVLMFLLLGFSIFLLMNLVDPKEVTPVSDGEKKRKGVSFIDGFKAIVTHPYVAGIFGVIFFQEVITTLMSLQLSRMVEITYLDHAVRTNFFFNYSVGLQIIAVLFSLLGTSFMQRTFGTRLCLIGFPVFLAACTGVYFFYPSLYVLVTFMLLAKSMHFALNAPIKESLYIPTTLDIKYKAKAWIDMFGQRFSKFFGAQVVRFIGVTPWQVGGVALSGLLIWTGLASVVGAANEKAVKTGKIIE